MASVSTGEQTNAGGNVAGVTRRERPERPPVGYIEFARFHGFAYIGISATTRRVSFAVNRKEAAIALRSTWQWSVERECWDDRYWRTQSAARPAESCA